MYNEENFKSQFGQDKILLSLIGEKKNGFFIELGACDGIFISNSYFFEKELGWGGILIEPTPSAFLNLKENRNCFTSDALCSDISGIEKDFLLAGAVSGVIDDTSGYWIKKNIDNDKIKKTTSTLEEVLDGFNCPTNIDFLSIDVEGHEFKVLKNFPFDKYIIDIICLENNSSIDNSSNIDDTKKLLDNNNYSIIHETGTDLFYKKLNN